MKLASLKSGRDGRLVVVSDDLSWCADASVIAPTLQRALDEWERCEGPLRAVAAALNRGDGPRSPFSESECASPLPRAYQWADGSAYVNHVALVRKARKAEMPESFWTDPLMYQGGSDVFLAPRDPIPLADESWGCDLEGEVAVITGDVRQGVTREEALKAIRLVMLVNDVSLRNLIPAELAKGFGFFQSKPSSAFSPVAVTPDALGGAWREGKLHGALRVSLNGEPFGRADAGVDMTFDFGTLVAHAARTRDLCAGSIIGSGTVSNRDADGGPGKPIRDEGLGYSCIAEVRTVETLLTGAAKTPFLRRGDRVRIEMQDAAGRSLFGAIDQVVAEPASMTEGRTRVFETPAGVALCTLDALADPGARNFVLQIDEAFFHGFLVRTGEHVRGYVDRCPHQGLPLAQKLDGYLTPDARLIACSWHGALFRLEDGVCVGGPCTGQQLTPWPVKVEHGVVRTA